MDESTEEEYYEYSLSRRLDLSEKATVDEESKAAAYKQAEEAAKAAAAKLTAEKAAAKQAAKRLAA